MDAGTDSAPLPIGARAEWDLRTNVEGQEDYFLNDPEAGFFGTPIEGGDLDCDGIDDVFLGSMRGSPMGRIDAGRGHIFLSDGVIAGSVDVAMSPPSVVKLYGAAPGDFFAVEGSIADHNGDGCDDLLVGVQNIDGPAGGRDDAGAAFLVMGRPVWPAEMDFAGPLEGVVRFHGASPGDRLGLWVDDIDLNQDGARDLMFGADQVDFGGRSNNGAEYIVLGDPAWTATMSDTTVDFASGLPPGTVTVYGVSSGDHFGCTSTAGDFDGDGWEDIVVSASLNRLSGAGPTGTGVGGGPRTVLLGIFGPSRARPTSSGTLAPWRARST